MTAALYLRLGPRSPFLDFNSAAKATLAVRIENTRPGRLLSDSWDERLLQLSGRKRLIALGFGRLGRLGRLDPFVDLQKRNLIGG